MATEPDDRSETDAAEREDLLRLIWERDYEANEDIYDELARE